MGVTEFGLRPPTCAVMDATAVEKRRDQGGAMVFGMVAIVILSIMMAMTLSRVVPVLSDFNKMNDPSEPIDMAPLSNLRDALAERDEIIDELLRELDGQRSGQAEAMLDTEQLDNSQCYIREDVLEEFDEIINQLLQDIETR